MMHHHEIYMQRCLQLAQLGEGFVAPNPMVGSVLVYNDSIIGEGYHQQYGKPHAEVNCLESVTPGNVALIPHSTLYVSLEPCAHFGKTPPCTKLIIRSGIEKVVVGCRDPFSAVNGKGIEQLQQAGIEVLQDVLAAACRDLNKRFFTYHTLQRPYIALKWAETADGFIGQGKGQLFISNSMTNRWVHYLRRSHMGILVGANTVQCDNPRLNIRHVEGNAPVRIIIDRNNKLDKAFNVFDNSQRTLLFSKQPANIPHIAWHQLKDEDAPAQVMKICYDQNIQSILIEGGAITLQSFIDAGIWDEAIIIRNTCMTIGDGIAAPSIKHAVLRKTFSIGTDQINIFKKQDTATLL